MSAIGPSLPPHLLAKRKRQQDERDADGASTAATATADKRRRLSDEKTETSRVRAAEKDENVEDEKSSAPARTIGPSYPPSEQRRVAGPAMPPASLDTRPASTSLEADDSDDDDLGPALPGNAADDDATEAANDTEDTVQAENIIAKPKRDDWMTMAPTQDGLAARMDPSMPRARGFNTGKSARAPTNHSAQTWNETAEQKQKRLADEVLGVSSSVASPRSNAQHVSKEKTQRDEEIARRIRDKADKARGPSLMDTHNEGKDVTEDDPSKRAFDREKDMGNASRITGSQKREMISKAAGYSNRFSGGSYL